MKFRMNYNLKYSYTIMAECHCFVDLINIYSVIPWQFKIYHSFLKTPASPLKPCHAAAHTLWIHSPSNHRIIKPIKLSPLTLTRFESSFILLVSQNLNRSFTSKVLWSLIGLDSVPLVPCIVLTWFTAQKNYLFFSPWVFRMSLIQPLSETLF